MTTISRIILHASNANRNVESDCAYDSYEIQCTNRSFVLTNNINSIYLSLANNVSQFIQTVECTITWWVFLIPIMKIEYTIPGKTSFTSEKHGRYKTLFTFTHLQELSTKNERYQVSIICKTVRILAYELLRSVEREDREFALFIKFVTSHERRQTGHMFIRHFSIIFTRTISCRSGSAQVTKHPVYMPRINRVAESEATNWLVSGKQLRRSCNCSNF